MSIINEILKKLPKKDQKLLMYAFENDICVYVSFDGDNFIGVNTEFVKKLVPESVIGKWSYGKIKKEETK